MTNSDFQQGDVFTSRPLRGHPPESAQSPRPIPPLQMPSESCSASSKSAGVNADNEMPSSHGPPFPNIDDGCTFYHKMRAERPEPCRRCKQQLPLSVAGQLTQNLSNHRNG
jgi:hypothetical protein